MSIVTSSHAGYGPAGPGHERDVVEPGGTGPDTTGAAPTSETRFPRPWLWGEDGDVAAGTFRRFDAGPTREYGRKPIAVLGIEGEDRSVWLMQDVLYNKFRDELADRPEHTLAIGERVVIERLGEKVSDSGRTYWNFRVLFPDRPEPSTETLFNLGPPPAGPTELPDAADPPEVAPDDGIPF